MSDISHLRNKTEATPQAAPTGDLDTVLDKMGYTRNTASRKEAKRLVQDWYAESSKDLGAASKLPDEAELRQQIRKAIGFYRPELVKSIGVTELRVPAARFEEITDIIVRLHQSHTSPFEQDLPVIRTTGLMDGDWTHTVVNTQAVRDFVEGILDEFAESSLPVATFMHNLGISIEWMSDDELKRVPEL